MKKNDEYKKYLVRRKKVVEEVFSKEEYKELTSGELIKLMTDIAKDYVVFAEDSLRRNGYSYPRPNKEQSTDVIIDFLNFAAGQYGMDYGLKPYHLREEKEKLDIELK